MCVSTHVCVCVCALNRLYNYFQCEQLGSSSPTGGEREAVCQPELHRLKAHWALEASSSFPTAEWKQVWLKNISSEQTFSSHLGDLNL